MRTCQSCGRQNPDDRDFCECGEYLRWEATGFVQAVTAPPETDSEPEPPQVVQAPPPTPPPAEDGNGHDTAVQPAPPPPPAAEPEGTTITLRLPDHDAEHGAEVAVGVEPGQRERVLALVRNQSGIVDNYGLRVEGLPDGWWSIFPDTVYLVPFGSSGTYEQEVEIQLHPPRTPEAEARIWELRVVAHSKAHDRDAASQPLALGIQPYTETDTRVRPERAKGRRRADYTVAVENRANAPVVVALEGSDPDGELAFGFDRPPADIPPGQATQTTMRVSPPKQIWLGRPVEHRFQVDTLTGDAAAERLAAEPEGADASPPARRGLLSRGQAFRPQVREPGVRVGPGGIDVRGPQVRAPKLRGPRVPSKDLKLSSLRPGGGAAAPAVPAAPLLPSQGIFRQKPWLPWWLVPVGMLLAMLAVLLYLLLPRNVVVPDVVGAASAFAAEEQLTEAGLRLAPEQKPEVDDEVEPGTVIGQTPAAGEEAEEDSEVAVLVAVGSGRATVPSIVGMTPAEAEQALREAKLTLGQASPQPIDPAGEIESQIPAEGQVVQEGTPVDIFFAEPGAGEGGGGVGGAGAGGAGGGDGGGGGGGAGGEVVVPAVEGAELEAYAQRVSDEGLVPEATTAFDASEPGTLFGTDPPAGTTVEAGSAVKLLVSGGTPELAFDDDEDILRVNGATGRKLDPIADGPAREKDPAFSPDGTRVAYVGGGRVFVADLEKPDEPADDLTSDAQELADLAWAPTTADDVLAMGRVQGEDRDLCLGRISRGSLEPRCLEEPGITIGGAIHWAPNGRSILAGGISNEQEGVFGVVRWRSEEPFSPDPGDWSAGRFVTDTSKPGEGVKEAALSPDGSRLALIAKIGDDPFRLVLAEPGDFPMTNARPTTVRACKLAWSGDGREIVVVKADALCNESVGSLVRLPVRNPRDQRELNASGDNPVFQPLTLGGGGGAEGRGGGGDRGGGGAVRGGGEG